LTPPLSGVILYGVRADLFDGVCIWTCPVNCVGPRYGREGGKIELI
jgi:hypothetical protein